VVPLVGESSSKPLSLRELGFTPRIVIFSIVWGIFNTIIFGALLIGVNSNPYIPFLTLIFMETFLMRAINRKLQFSIQEWTVFLTFEMSGFLGCVSYNATSDLWHIGTYRAFYRGFVKYFGTVFEALRTHNAPVSSVMFLWRDDVVNGYLYGGSIDWAGWAPSIIFYILNWASMYVGMHFLSIIFRKIWIEEEELPFPWQQPLYEFLKRAKEYERPSLWSLKPLENKVFWLFFLLGVIYQALNVSNWWWGTEFMQSYTVNLIPMFYEAFPCNLWSFTLVPTTIAAAYLMPLDVVGTAAFSFVFFEGFINWLNIVTGSVTRMDFWSNQWLNGSEQGLIKYHLLFGGWHGCGFGPIYIAIPLVLVWKARRRIIDSIKKAVKGIPADEGEAHSWRTVWLGFIICTIIWYATVLWAGAPPEFIISYFGLIGLFLWTARYIAETGGAGVYVEQFEFDHNLMMYLEPLRATGILGFNTPSAVSLLNIHTYTGWAAQHQPLMPSLVLFKIGAETKTHPRVISIAMLIAMVLGIVIAVPLGIWTYFHHSATFLYGRLLEHEGIVYQLGGWPPGWPYLEAQPKSYAEFVGIPDYYSWFLGGIILIFVLEFLRARFTWFFFNPIGVVFGVGGPAHWFYGGNMIIAFILKWFTLKIGGADAYNKVGVTAASGLLLGSGFTLVWGSLISLTRTL